MGSFYLYRLVNPVGEQVEAGAGQLMPRIFAEQFKWRLFTDFASGQLPVLCSEEHFLMERC
ncbi:MAG TPA: hypothetical protein DCF63_18230 [Planctomycetaceae bacterium]|nr:hypothetical protein [Planctomycetaceae bacterium]